MANVNRPNHPCTFPPCGGTVYKNLGTEWECCNCLHRYPKKSHPRRKNTAIAFDHYRSLKSLWEPIDHQLRVLVADGTVKSGAMLVHASTFNFHMDRLLTGLDENKKKLTGWAVRYHKAKATEDLKKAAAFIDSFAPAEKTC